MYSLTFLQTRSLNSSCHRVVLPLEALEKNLFLASFRLLVTANIHWHSLACGYITPIFVLHFLLFCVYVKSPSAYLS